MWAATAGAAVLGGYALRRRTFLLFVLALGVVVAAVQDAGLRDAVAAVVPDGASLPALLAVAALAAVLANVLNNLPATLLLLPVVAPTGPPAVLAVLIGVNLGPNLAYTGSLATLLWRRLLGARSAGPRVGEFTRLGLATVPLSLVACTGALWAVLRLLG